MSVYEREPFADFLAKVIQIRTELGKEHAAHASLMAGRSNDEETVASISSSPDETVRARKALRTIHQDFPYGAAVPEQAAYLVRAFVGLNPFEDDDNETGWRYLHELLAAHGWHLGAEAQAVANRTHQLQSDMESHYVGGFQRRHALDRDPILDSLTKWFEEFLVGSSGADQHL